MSNINYSLKARCQGCLALQTTSDSFKCQFGLPLHFEEDAGGAKIQPSPDQVKCYKPKTAADMKAVRAIMEQKLAKENA